tara:strand:- start:1031 stop:1486 length:456 start_codon:yes stop_codon:yes gene_type:complete
MKKAILLMLLCLGISCSGSHQTNPNTTLTSDYYGIRESTSGGGYDDPIEAERLLLGNSRPLILIFSAPWSRPSRVLLDEISKMEMHDKVWVLDIAHPVSSMLAVFVDADEHVPSMVYLGRYYEKIKKSDLISIIEFLDDYKKGTIKENIYE